MMLMLAWVLGCGGESPEPVAPPPEPEVLAPEVEPAVSPLAEDAPLAGVPDDFSSVPWLGFSTIPEGMKGCRLDQKFGNTLFDNSLAMRCGKGGRILAASVSTERWEASANELRTQAEGALGEPERTDVQLGWTVKQWTQTRSAVTALLQRDGTTVYMGCVDGPSERTCERRVAQLITGLGKAPVAE